MSSLTRRIRRNANRHSATGLGRQLGVHSDCRCPKPKTIMIDAEEDLLTLDANRRDIAVLNDLTKAFVYHGGKRWSDAGPDIQRMINDRSALGTIGGAE